MSVVMIIGAVILVGVFFLLSGRDSAPKVAVSPRVQAIMDAQAAAKKAKRDRYNDPAYKAIRDREVLSQMKSEAEFRALGVNICGTSKESPTEAKVRALIRARNKGQNQGAGQG